MRRAPRSKTSARRSPNCADRSLEFPKTSTGCAPPSIIRARRQMTASAGLPKISTVLSASVRPRQRSSTNWLRYSPRWRLQPGHSQGLLRNPWPSASAASGTEVTGSVSPSERAASPRKVIKGWSVREAYEGLAILNGPTGVVEAVLGQQVPGLGRIEEIKNESGRLVVLSSAGAILSSRKATP